jgi:hypothetical protein
MITTLNRITTLISEGYTTRYEVDQYATDKAMLEAWVLTLWNRRHNDFNARVRAGCAAQDAAWNTTRPAVVAAVKNAGGYREDNSLLPEVEKYGLKTKAEIVEWKKRKGI